jgi:hypothetical protein
VKITHTCHLFSKTRQILKFKGHPWPRNPTCLGPLMVQQPATQRWNLPKLRQQQYNKMLSINLRPTPHSWDSLQAADSNTRWSLCTASSGPIPAIIENSMKAVRLSTSTPKNRRLEMNSRHILKLFSGIYSWKIIACRGTSSIFIRLWK